MQDPPAGDTRETPLAAAKLANSEEHTDGFFDCEDANRHATNGTHPVSSATQQQLQKQQR